MALQSLSIYRRLEITSAFAVSSVALLAITRGLYLLCSLGRLLGDYKGLIFIQRIARFFSHLVAGLERWRLLNHSLRMVPHS
jgi:hypothetical protein